MRSEFWFRYNEFLQILLASTWCRGGKKKKKKKNFEIKNKNKKMERLIWPSYLWIESLPSNNNTTRRAMLGPCPNVLTLSPILITLHILFERTMSTQTFHITVVKLVLQSLPAVLRPPSHRMRWQQNQSQSQFLYSDPTCNFNFNVESTLVPQRERESY